MISISQKKRYLLKMTREKNDACMVPTNTEETVIRDSVQYRAINNTGINLNLNRFQLENKQTLAY